MIKAIHSALAGMNASFKRAGIAAGNIANVRSGGRAEPYDGYVPLRAVQGTGAAGGPRVRAVPANDPSVTAYGDGLVGYPNVSIASEIVDMKLAQRSYEASLAVLAGVDELQRELVDREA